MFGQHQVTKKKKNLMGVKKIIHVICCRSSGNLGQINLKDKTKKIVSLLAPLHSRVQFFFSSFFFSQGAAPL